MSAKPDLWMPLYFGAYLTDTMHLKTEQHGAYFLLLMACWKRGGELPDDDEQLAAITRLTIGNWRKARALIAPFWQIKGGVWTQKRLTRELESARERSATAAENGKKGGRPRKADENPDDNQNETQQEPGAKPKHNPGESSVPLPRPLQTQGPLPSPSPLPESTPVAPDASRRTRPKPVNVEAKSGPTWEAYSTAYRERHGVDPTRNASVNGKLARFLERVPIDEAPEIAAFFVRSNRGFYVSRKHPVGSLLADAEALRTEWLTGRAGTQTEAMQADRTAATGNVFRELIEENRNAGK